MSNVTIHLVIPTLILLMTRLFPTRQVLMWAPFAVVPDLDTVVNLFTFYVMGETVFAHRAILHNVFVFLPTLAISIWLWRRMLAERADGIASSWHEKWLAFGSVRWGYASVLITFYLFTHVLLDTFTGGTTLLWPLVNNYVYPQLFIWVDMSTGMPSGEATVTTGAGAPTLSRRYPWMTPEQVAIWILVFLGAIVSMWWEATAKAHSALAVQEFTDPRMTDDSKQGDPSTLGREAGSAAQEAEGEAVKTRTPAKGPDP